MKLATLLQKKQTKLFITGTDTGAGKSYVSTAILNEARQAGMSTLGIKPVASGCENIQGEYRNTDALALQQASSIKLPYEKINPFAFLSPIAPHLAAREENKSLSVKLITESIHDALQEPADLCIIEGAGGWYVPLNEKETIADLVKTLQLPVILVVGIRLGCINHSLLTQRALQHDAVNVIGWIANCLDPGTSQQNLIIETLKTHLLFQHLATLDYNENSSLTNLLY